jgi:hypothetical protein
MVETYFLATVDQVVRIVFYLILGEGEGLDETETSELKGDFHSQKIERNNAEPRPDSVMLSRVRGAAAIHATSIGTPPFSLRPFLIPPLIVRHRVMSSNTDFKQVRFIPHLHTPPSSHLPPGTSQVSSQSPCSGALPLNTSVTCRCKAFGVSTPQIDGIPCRHD